MRSKSDLVERIQAEAKRERNAQWNAAMAALAAKIELVKPVFAVDKNEFIPAPDVPDEGRPDLR